MKTRISVVLALTVAVLFALLPGIATAMPSEAAVTTTERKIVVEVTPQDVGFDVNVYNGTDIWMMVSGVGHDQNPGSNYSWLASGSWSRSYTGIEDVDQLQVPGCGLTVQGSYYPAGTWAQVHGVTPVLYVFSVNC